MRKILIVLEAGGVYLSGYVRGLIYRDLFVKNGFEPRYVSRQPTGLLRLSLTLRKTLPRLIAGILERLLKILQEISAYFREFYIARLAKDYETVYMIKVEKSRFVGRLKKKTNARIIYDYGDAMWLKKGSDIQTILRSVDAVIAVNDYTAAYARRFNANCAVVPDSPQLEEFDRKRPNSARGNKSRIVLGWIGTPSSFYPFDKIEKPLEQLFSKYPNLQLRLLGVGYKNRLLARFKNIRYSVLPYYNQSDMIREVLNMDIGLYPLCEGEQSKARGILKAAIYMSGEAACVASPLEDLRGLIADGTNGMLAGSEEEWKQKLERLITDPDLREKIARNGLETARANFSLEKNFNKILRVLK